MVCTVTRLKYAALVGLSFGRPRKKGLVQTAREIPGNLFQITWTGVRSDGLMGAICFIAVEKRPEYGQWGRMVPANTSCLSLSLSPFLPSPLSLFQLAQSPTGITRSWRAYFQVSRNFLLTVASSQRKQKLANEERVETLTSVILFPPLKVFAHISSAIFSSPSRPSPSFLLSLATVFLSDELITRSRESLATIGRYFSGRKVVRETRYEICQIYRYTVLVLAFVRSSKQR